MLRDAELGYAVREEDGRPVSSQQPLLHGCGVPTPGPAAARQSPYCGSHSHYRETDPISPTLASSRSAIWSSRPAELGDRRDAQRWAVEAGWLVAQQHLHDTIYGAIAYTAGALAHNQRGDQAEAARQLENVRRLRPLLRAGPWLNADLALRCADISLDIGDVAGALELAQVAGDALQGYPDAGTLPARLQRLEAADRARDRTTDSHLPSSDSSLSCGRISPSRRSPIVFTSHALPSRHTSRRSTSSSASQADPTLSRSSSRPASNRQKPRSRCQFQISTGVAMPHRRWLTGQAARLGSSEGDAPAMRRPPADTPDVAA